MEASSKETETLPETPPTPPPKTSSSTVVHPSPSTPTPPKPPTPKKSLPVPLINGGLSLAAALPPRTRISCTHITMDRIHVYQACDICGRHPPLGWLYACRQDKSQGVVHYLNNTEPVPPGSSPLSPFYDCHFSPSIKRQITEGRYTDEQLNLLKQQRENVQLALQQHSQRSKDLRRELADEETLGRVHPNVTVRRSRRNSVRREAMINMLDGGRCGLKCCHTCRPYYRDRVFASLNAIADSRHDTYTGCDYENLKLADSAIVRQLGLRKQKGQNQPPDDPISSDRTIDNASSLGSGHSIRQILGENQRHSLRESFIRRALEKVETEKQRSQSLAGEGATLARDKGPGLTFLEKLKAIGRKGIKSLRKTKSSPLGSLILGNENAMATGDKRLQRRGSAPASTDSSQGVSEVGAFVAETSGNYRPLEEPTASLGAPLSRSSLRASIHEKVAVAANHGPRAAENDVVRIHSTLPIRTRQSSLPERTSPSAKDPWDDYVTSVNRNINGAGPSHGCNTSSWDTAHRPLADRQKQTELPAADGPVKSPILPFEHLDSAVASGLLLPGFHIVDSDILSQVTTQGEGRNRLSGVAEVAMSEMAVEEHVPDMVTTVDLTLGVNGENVAS